MYDHREMKYEQKIKDNFILLFFYIKKYETLHLQETESYFLLDYLRQCQMSFEAMR